MSVVVIYSIDIITDSCYHIVQYLLLLMIIPRSNRKGLSCFTLVYPSICLSIIKKNCLTTIQVLQCYHTFCLDI